MESTRPPQLIDLSSLIIGMTFLQGAMEVWRAAVPPKVKFFFWLALHGRLWIVERRMRHGLQDEAACTLCDQADETTDHLLASCVYSCEVWFRLLHSVGQQLLAPKQNAGLADWWLRVRVRVPRHL